MNKLIEMFEAKTGTVTFGMLIWGLFLCSVWFMGSDHRTFLNGLVAFIMGISFAGAVIAVVRGIIWLDRGAR